MQENWSVKYIEKIENITGSENAGSTRKPREMEIFECTEDS